MMESKTFNNVYGWIWHEGTCENAFWALSQKGDGHCRAGQHLARVVSALVYARGGSLPPRTLDEHIGEGGYFNLILILTLGLTLGLGCLRVRQSV